MRVLYTVGVTVAVEKQTGPVLEPVLPAGVVLDPYVGDIGVV